MVYGHIKDLTRRAAADKIFRDTFNIAKKLKYGGYQRRYALVVYKCFDKKSSGNGIGNENMLDQKLAEELHNPINGKFKKRKVHANFTDNIWGTNLDDMQLISKSNNVFRFLLHVIDIFSKYGLFF